MPKISACMVIYNEERVLERCLKSLKPVVDEIVIVHDGECRDESLNIAAKYDAKVFIQSHRGSSEGHRAFSYDKASGDWILQIDADEFLPPQTQAIIPDMVRDEQVDAYDFRWAPTDGAKEIGRAFAKNTKVFLFRKSKAYFIGITHEFPKTHGNSVIRPDIDIYHQPAYNNYTFKSMRTKWFKWGRIQAKQITSLPDADTFGVNDITQTFEYDFYRRMINHPFRITIKYAYDMARKVIADIKQHPGSPIDLESWKILTLSTINYVYLGFCLYKQRSRVTPQSRWWEGGIA